MDGRTAVVVAMFCLLIILVIFGPIFTIWSLNLLFGLKIPVTFETWAAVIWLMTIFHGIKFQIKKN